MMIKIAKTLLSGFLSYYRKPRPNAMHGYSCEITPYVELNIMIVLCEVLDYVKEIPAFLLIVPQIQPVCWGYARNYST